MKPYRRYGDWLKNSNEAGVFREAFEISDKMPIEVRMAVVEAIYAQSKIKWGGGYQRFLEEQSR